MPRLGIVTLYDNSNIGNKLQNYAVQCFFENLDFECETIPHWEMAHKKISVSLLKQKLIVACGYPHNSAMRLRLEGQRKRRFKQFSDRYLKLGRQVKIQKLPKNLASRYDFFSVGSDQVWHNWTRSKAEIDYFMLQFARENQRLTISPSFGLKTVDEQFRGDYIRGLQGIPVITCREQAGADIVKELTGKQAQVLLDPTMLIDTGKWIDIEKKPESAKTGRYILVYALGEMSEAVRSWIRETSETMDLAVIDILDPSIPELYLTTPDEFLYYIHHAELVVTDSFHASVFSILMKRPFVVFNRNTASMGDMSSRLQTLLEAFSLQDRQFGLCKNAFHIDFSAVDGVLQKEREKTITLYRDTFRYLNSL